MKVDFDYDGNYQIEQLEKLLYSSDDVIRCSAKTYGLYCRLNAEFKPSLWQRLNPFKKSVHGKARALPMTGNNIPEQALRPAGQVPEEENPYANPDIRTYEKDAEWHNPKAKMDRLEAEAKEVKKLRKENTRLKKDCTQKDKLIIALAKEVLFERGNELASEYPKVIEQANRRIRR